MAEGQPEDARIAELFVRIARGQSKALETLFREFSDAVFRFLVQLSGAPSDADDLVQVTFMNLWKYRQRLGQHPNPRAYLYSVALNAWRRDLSRRRRRDEVYRSYFQEVPSSDHSRDPRSALELAENQRWVWNALDKLPEKQRVALILHRFHDMTASEIARVHDAPVKTIESRLRLGLQRVLEQLKLQEGLR